MNSPEHREYEGVGEHENHLGGREAGIDPEVAGLRPAESVHGPIGQPEPRPNLCALIFDEDHKLTTTRMPRLGQRRECTRRTPALRPGQSALAPPGVLADWGFVRGLVDALGEKHCRHYGDLLHSRY